jgi:type IV pilus assembly protein PilB
VNEDKSTPTAEVASRKPPADDEQDFVREHLGEGRIFVKYGLADKARKQFEAVLARFPDNLEALHELLDLYRDDGARGAVAREQRAMNDLLRPRRDTTANETKALAEPGKTHVSLPELLLTQNLLSPQQLRAALDHQKASGGRLRRAIVSLGFIKDEEITKLLSRHYGLPSIDLSHFEVDPSILKILPADTARRYQALPLSVSGAVLSIAMADPTNVVAMDDIKSMTGYDVQPVVSSESALEDAMDRYYGSTRWLGLQWDTGPVGGGHPKAPTLSVDDLAAIGGLSEIDLDSTGDAEADIGRVEPEEEEIDLGNPAKSANASPVVKLMSVILVDSLVRGASDIHVEPYERAFRVRFRIDGVLHNVMGLPMALRDPLTQHIRQMARLNPTEKRVSQDGRIRIRVRVEDRSLGLAFRVLVRPTLWGETIVMRRLDESTLLLDVSRLGFEPRSLERFTRALSMTRGIVLVTGPQRSGKTQTLMAALASLNRPDIHILTAGHGVDFSLPGINQIQADEHAGESTATVLRSARDLGADVLLVDEIRDFETANLAFRLAEEGRLVLSTLCTSDAPSTVTRLLSMGLDRYRVATTVNVILAQRLVRRVCTKCRAEAAAEMSSSTLIEVGFTADQVGTFQAVTGKGCASCNGTGYKGLVGLYEVMEITDGIRDLILVGATAAEIKRRALEEGMLTLRMSGLVKIRNSMTTVEEVLRKTVL